MPQQTIANGEQLASVRAKLNGNAADVETRFGEVDATLGLKADLVDGLVPTEQLPGLSSTDLGAVFVQTDLAGILPATNPGSGRPWVDTSGLMRVGAGAGGTIPYIPSPTPVDGSVAMFDGLGGLKATGNATFPGGLVAREVLELKHDQSWFTRLQAEANLAETRFINTYPGSSTYGGWSFRNGSTPEVERAKIYGDGVLLGQAYTTAFQSGYDRRSRMQTSGWLNGHGNFISYLDGSGGCVEIGATFRTQSDVNLGGYCAATNPNELVYFYIGTYGAELMTLAPATGRVGIGTTSPQSQLEVYKQGAFISLQQPVPGINGIRFGDGGTARGTVFVDGVIGEMRHEVGYAGWGGFYSFYNNGAEHFRIHENGVIGMGQDPGYEYLGSRCTVRHNQNAITRHLVRNEDTGNSAGAEFTINAYGNSWSLGMGSAANNGNGFYIGKDATLGAPTDKYFHITTGGLVGIQTATPLSGLSVRTTAALENGNPLRFYSSGDTNYAAISGAGTGDLALSTGGVPEAVRFTNNGRVGIGTSSPLYQVEIHSNAGADYYALGLRNSSTTPGAKTILALPVFNGTTGLQICQQANATGSPWGGGAYDAMIRTGQEASKLHFAAGSVSDTPALTVDFNKSIGIGTTSPVYKLDVHGAGDDVTSGSLQVLNTSDTANAAAIVAVRSATSRGSLAAYPASYVSTSYADRVVLSSASDAGGISLDASSAGQDIRFAVANVEQMRVDSAGNVGIGTLGPTTKLHVRTGGSGTDPGGIRIENNNSDTWLSYPGDGRNYIRGTTILCDLGGNLKVGAGSVDPAYLLQVNGVAHVQNLRIPNTQSIAWAHSGDGYDWFTASVNSSNLFTLSANNGSLTLDGITGHCGIGNAAPTDRLTVGNGTSDTRIHSQSGSTYAVRVSNGVGNGGYHFGATASATTPDGVFCNHAGVERMRITDAGNLGVGTTNPTQRLDVGGTIKSTSSFGLLVSPASADDSAYARYDNSGGSTYFGMDDIDGNSLSGTAYAAAINTPVAVVCVIGGVVRSTLNANGEYLNGDLVISGGGGFGRTVAVGVGGAVQHNSLAIFGHATSNYAPVLSLYRVSSRECALAVAGGDLCFANTGGFANYQDSTLLAASSLRLRSTGEVTTTSSFETQGATVGASNSWQAKSQDVASGYWSLISTNSGHGMQMHAGGYLDTTFGYAIHTGSADPTVSDIASNSSLMWKNSTSGEVRHWVNDGGTMLKSAAYS